MQQDLCELGFQGPARWWDGGETSELAWICVHTHCQHLHTPLPTKAHLMCVCHALSNETMLLVPSTATAP